MPVDNSSAVANPGSLVVWSSTRLGGDRRFFSTWSALGNPVFRKLWITRPNSFRLEMNVPSWNEHLLQKERMTKAEKELLQNALEPAHGLYTARRTDLPIREQRIAHAKAM